MGTGFQDEEAQPMKCHVCGSKMKPWTTDLPFKVDDTTIVIMKGLPVLQCENCSEYSLDDIVMKRIEEILDKVDSSAELEIIRYAA
jgi:YgiT-type zinc finger domain-containing protein